MILLTLNGLCFIVPKTYRTAWHAQHNWFINDEFVIHSTNCMILPTLNGVCFSMPKTYQPAWHVQHNWFINDEFTIHSVIFLFVCLFFCLSKFHLRPRFSTPEILLYFSLQHPLHTWMVTHPNANHGPSCYGNTKLETPVPARSLKLSN